MLLLEATYLAVQICKGCHACLFEFEQVEMLLLDLLLLSKHDFVFLALT